MKKSDHTLGMGRKINRRDFVHRTGLAALGIGLSNSVTGCAPTNTPAASYPPTRTGLRGSHQGSYEVAHALARERKGFGAGRPVDREYDLIVVGGGLSGLAAAYYYRQLHGPDSRILILENHDDFGGHAKRNEFHQGGPMRLAWGGVFNLEYPMFSDRVNHLMQELGVDLDQLTEQTNFNYGVDGRRGPATYFDADTYGRDVLLADFIFRHGDYSSIVAQLDQVPLDADSRASLRDFYTRRTDVLAGLSQEKRRQFLTSTSYTDFLREHGGLTEAAAELFRKTTHGYCGVSADSLSVAECEGAGLPMSHLLGRGVEESTGSVGGEVAMFPDGNASLARLMVRALIPEVAPGQSMNDVVTAPFDYSMLDRPESKVRIRLESTVVNVVEEDELVRATYVSEGETLAVAGKHCVLACYHSIIPFLCPQLPQTQRKALSRQVKSPLLLTNVLLRSSRAADQLGISGAYCPGRLHGATWLVKGIRAGEYQHPWEDSGPVVMQFWGSVSPPPGLSIHDQHRAARQIMLSMKFEAFEREVRTVLDGMLGSAGFEVADDVLAITVNRWPHGYSYGYLDLWDPTWPAGEAPHEIARQPFGRITFANADAGADAYSHVAIDEAWRAVRELSS